MAWANEAFRDTARPATRTVQGPSRRLQKRRIMRLHRNHAVYYQSRYQPIKKRVNQNIRPDSNAKASMQNLNRWPDIYVTKSLDLGSG